MLKALILLLGLIPLCAHARLGQTPDQLEQRFGEPVGSNNDMIIAQGKMIALCLILTFKQDDWFISCHIIDGRSAQESYRKKGDWTEDQIQLVLTSNAQGAKWTEITKPATKNLKREWQREDGATALWRQGQGIDVTHPAYPLAKQRAQDKAKANASRLPNL